MTITDLDCAQANIDLYADSTDFVDIIYPEADLGVCWSVRRRGDDDLVCFRGSRTPQDWFRDFLVIPHVPELHPKFGYMDLGFMAGMDDSCARIYALLRDSSKIYITGHSLGAARATNFCGMLIEHGINPRRIVRVVFGEPRSACGEFNDYIEPISESVSYRNIGVGWHDCVTDAPTSPPFSHSKILTDQKVTPLADDPWGLLRYHRMELYFTGLGGKI